MKRLVLLTLASPALADGPVIPQFIEETASAGFAHTFAGEWEFVVGGGAAVFDCSGDGLPEVFLAGGTNPSALFLNDSSETLAFRKAEASGLELDSVSGAYPIDIDADGLTDLAVLRVGTARLMRGLGDCTFADASADWGFKAHDLWHTAFAATWERGADWPTLAFGSYIDRTQEEFPWGNCTENLLYRGAKGQFSAPLPLEPAFCTLSMLFTDWNRSGTPALRVSNDREYYKGGQEQLWHIEAGAEPRLYTEAEGWKRLRIWGMGIASRDLNDDGYPEYYLTSMADQKLQFLTAPGPDAKPQYADEALKRGVTAHQPYTGGDLRPSTGWHAQFSDVNNDGWADLFVVKGNVWAMPDFAESDPNNLFLGQEDGTFVEAGDKAGVASMLQGRGGALADLNGDGLVDMLVVNRNGPAQVWRNTGPAGNWVAIRPQMDGANRDAVNAWVELRTGGRVQRQEVLIGGGQAGGILMPLHFGLGAAGTAEARVIWPDGTEGNWLPVALGQVNVISP
ncbi:MAG: CRTAC1 family protein [Tabrizicola sp.]|nr:CRTAC1 family protein [Tabrizicola sp.]